MTRIIVIVDAETRTTYSIEDPRSPREIVMAINTQSMRAGEESLELEGRRQWATHQPPLNVVTVVLEPPPVMISRRHYQVLFALADEKDAATTAAELGISRRTVYTYIRDLKERFGVQTKEELLAMAAQFGLVW